MTTDMKIFVWGTGAASMDLLDEGLDIADVAGFIDNAPNEKWRGKPVYQPAEMVDVAYDIIVVAADHGAEIDRQARELHLDTTKFVYAYGNQQLYDLNGDYVLASRIFSPSYIEAIKKRKRLIREMDIDSLRTPDAVSAEVQDMLAYDYNRMRVFELIRQEIDWGGVDGAAAELGVFQGRFARCINALFPDRTLYLFDTFEGFRESEAAQEKAAGHCTDSLIERCKDTSMEAVLELMPHRDKIICKKGLFPESLDGLEDRFAFVSLDVDFEQAIYDGLDYFYPRMNTGGYMMIHDYNSKTLRGVRNAVERYERYIGRPLAKVPLPDIFGTLVLVKYP